MKAIKIGTDLEEILYRADMAPAERKVARRRLYRCTKCRFELLSGFDLENGMCMQRKPKERRECGGSMVAVVEGV